MPVITILSGSYCRKDLIIEKLNKKVGYTLLSDADFIKKAVKLSQLTEKKITRALTAKTSVFDNITHEKDRATAFLRLAVAQTLAEDNLIIDGMAGLLIPKTVAHVLRTCLIGDMDSRVARAGKEEKLSEKDAINKIHKHDENKVAWIKRLYRINDPWDASLYDILVPVDKMKDDEIISLIEENLKAEVIKPTDSSKKAANDFIQAAEIEVALAKEGHTAEVSVRDGVVTLTINKNVLMLNRLEEELKSIVSGISGVKSVETRVGKGFYKTDIYRKYDFETSSKVLLVDDEREFVQTLSERLLMRDMGSAVAYDGDSALKLVAEDEPEVMILDLKMPGIDGFEVLKQVKKTRPEIEVIILTGHGSEKDRDVCMNLGAFAYLQKPVDIDLLSETLRKANEKIRKKKDTDS